MVAHIPELPNGCTLNAISFIVITVIYLFFLSYNIMQLNYCKLSMFFKSRQNKIVSNTTAKRRRCKRQRRGRHTKTRRPKRRLLPKHYIKIFTTNMSLLATAKASASSISLTQMVCLLLLIIRQLALFVTIVPSLLAVLYNNWFPLRQLKELSPSNETLELCALSSKMIQVPNIHMMCLGSYMIQTLLLAY